MKNTENYRTGDDEESENYKRKWAVLEKSSVLQNGSVVWPKISYHILTKSPIHFKSDDCLYEPTHCGGFV